MSIEGLPPEVMDNILSCLDRQDIAFLSRASKSLYAYANQFLYATWARLSANPDLDNCLRLNPANARYLRFYVCVSFELLGRILPEFRRVETLRLAPEDGDDSEASFPLECTSMHPEASIRHLICQLISPRALYWRHVLSHLSLFRDLVRLTLSFDSIHIDYAREVELMVKDLECPQLVHLTFNDAVFGQFVLDFDRLPSLRILHYHYRSGIHFLCTSKDGFGTTKSERKRVKDLQARGIYLLLTVIEDEAFFDRSLWIIR